MSEGLVMSCQGFTWEQKFGLFIPVSLLWHWGTNPLGKESRVFHVCLFCFMSSCLSDSKASGQGIILHLTLPVHRIFGWPKCVALLFRLNIVYHAGQRILSCASAPRSGSGPGIGILVLPLSFYLSHFQCVCLSLSFSLHEEVLCTPKEKEILASKSPGFAHLSSPRLEWTNFCQSPVSVPTTFFHSTFSSTCLTKKRKKSGIGEHSASVGSRCLVSGIVLFKVHSPRAWDSCTRYSLNNTHSSLKYSLPGPWPGICVCVCVYAVKYDSWKPSLVTGQEAWVMKRPKTNTHTWRDLPAKTTPKAALTMYVLTRQAVDKEGHRAGNPSASQHPRSSEWAFFSLSYEFC